MNQTVNGESMDETWGEQRSEVLAAAKAIAACGLVTGTAGNVSARLPRAGLPDLYLVTPAGTPYETMTAGDLVLVDCTLEPLDGDGIPSTESLMHLAIYRARPDVQAIVHTHSVFATVAAITGSAIPPVVDELVVYVGGPVSVAEYGPPASQELADAVVKALGDRRAVLLRHHGLCAVGASPKEALEVSTLVERVAEIYFYANLAGAPNTLPSDVIESEQAIYRMRAGLGD